MTIHHLSTTAAFFLLLLTTTITTTATVDSDSLQEIDTMMEVLRSRGYNLFSNAITTSDIQYQLLSSANNAAAANAAAFTIFAPKDSHLYSLDMDSDASAYVSTLRYHVSPNRRLTLSDLRNLTSPFLDTLLPHFNVLVSTSKARRRNGSVLSSNHDSKMDTVRVDGVSITEPDLYVGSRFVAHGLDGILVTGLVKNEDLVDEKSKAVVSTPAEAPVTKVEEDAEVFQVLPPAIEVAPPIKAPVTAETKKGLKIKKRGKKHHHHRRNRTHRRQSRIADHRKEDL